MKELHWFDVELDTPMGQIGWVWVVLGALVSGLIIAIWRDRELFRIRIPDRNCQHLRTRCLHGDEITWRAKQYVFRWWKEDVIRRQACRDCGRALDRSAICTVTGRDIHEWNGDWREDGY